MLAIVDYVFECITEIKVGQAMADPANYLRIGVADAKHTLTVRTLRVKDAREKTEHPTSRRGAWPGDN
jgi:hypothetical protein